MKEIYSWVIWFRELAKKIEKKGEAYLIEKAKEVDWGNKRSLLGFGDENIDPFSFFYFLASKNTKRFRDSVYHDVHRVFEIEGEPPKTAGEDTFVIPTPSGINVLFHDASDFHPDLLWRLFRQAAKDKPDIQAEDFDAVLKINKVAVPKLTQTLFLINPCHFIPIDHRFKLLIGQYNQNLRKEPDINKQIEAELTELTHSISAENGWNFYKDKMERVRQTFPGCHQYEINLFLFCFHPNKIELGRSFYQISTNVYNDGNDHWPDFEKNNWVRTGGPRSNKPYPVKEPKPGDIILVRTGEYRGRAIGIVEKNDYADKGYFEDGRIHVVWINKTENNFSERTGVRDGFSKVGADYQIYNSFRNITRYTPTFEFIESFMLRTVEDKAQVIENANNFNELTATSDSYVYTVFNNFTHWYYFQESDIFAPSKFIGYKNTTLENYRRGEGRHGGETEKILKKWFKPLEQNSPLFKEISTKLDKYVRRLDRKVKKNFSIHIENPEGHAVSQEQEPKTMKNPPPLNQILYGPPGTGKTWNTVNHAVAIIKKWPVEKLLENEEREVIKKRFDDELANDKGQIDMVTFHQNYSYEDFIEGIRPVLSGRDNETGNKELADKGGIRYELSPGIFKKIVERARNDEEQNYVLIIDEINRGNIAKIFGELITLIEESKRLRKKDAATATLPYSKESFGIPNNLYIIGTMNTADRSIALLDTALRRRFEFIEMMPEPGHSGISENIDGVNCRELLKAMNERIRILHDREHQIGHTYFMKVENINSLAKRFKNQIIPLLQEYFYDNWEKIDLVLNENGFITNEAIGKKREKNQSLFKKNSELVRDNIDDTRKIYELSTDYEELLKKPDSYIKIYQAETQPQHVGQNNQTT